MDVEYLMLRRDMDIMDMDSVPDMSSSSCQLSGGGSRDGREDFRGDEM